MAGHGGRKRRIWRQVLWAAVCCAMLGLWGGCSSERRYRVLTFFFDGVPDPNAPAGTAARGEAQVARVVYTHKPYTQDKCNACHKGGVGSIFQPSSDIEIGSDVCLKCHERVLSQYPVMHGPVTAVECLRCHAPHESSSPALLAAPSPNVCTQCHVADLLSSPPPEHRQPKVNCLDCHSGHGGARHGLLRDRPTTSPTPSTAPATAPVRAMASGPTAGARSAHTRVPPPVLAPTPAADQGSRGRTL